MIEPLLKWPGGKRWLAFGNNLPQLPAFRRYLEPFVGGGAIFFSLLPRRGVLSDLNADLINLYSVCRDAPGDLVEALRVHQRLHCKEYYYHVRSSKPNSPLARAAQMLYLNRTCWNGLYRVNKKGEFNVPIGTKTSVIMERDDFFGVANALREVELKCCDFEATVDEADRGDLLFVDPPYTVRHNENGFIKYNEDIFRWEDQIRLRDALVRASKRGSFIIVTNGDHSSIHDLYRGNFEYRRLERSTVLSGYIKGRGKTSEAMFLNF